MINRKILLLYLILIQTGFITENLYAQNNITITYRDSLWLVTSQNKAVYKVIKEFTGTAYHSKAYNVKDNYYIGYGDYNDTTYGKPVGTHVEYFKSGKIKDSSFYGNDSKPAFRYIYYENGKLRAESHYNTDSKTEVSRGFDENGNEIPEYIIEREAAFPGESDGWRKHIIKHLNAAIPVKKKAPKGTYQVVIRFIVDTDGSISNFEAETSFGYGMEEEVIRVLKKSPDWIPAVQYNIPVKAFRRQPVTFMVD